MELTDEKRADITKKFHNFLGEHNNQIYFIVNHKEELKTFEIEIFSRVKGLNSQKYFTRYFGDGSLRKGFKELGNFCINNNVGFVKY